MSTAKDLFSNIASEIPESELYRYSIHQLATLPFSCVAYQVTLDQTYPYHWLEFFELGLVLSGTSIHMINGNRYPLSPGSLFLLSPSDFHSMILPPGQQLKLAGVVFMESLIDEDLKQMLFQNRYYFNLDSSRLAGSPIQQLLFEILQEFQQKKPGSQHIIAACLQMILVHLTRLDSYEFPTATEQLERLENQFESIQRALLFIHHHFRQSITLADVASQVFLSPNYFSERFHAALGISFQQYLQNLRLKFAEALLSVTSLPVSEILFAAGFNDPSHFGRLFRQTFHLSPREYRKSKQERIEK